jgi:transcriptional regulator with XRE-family HTH domain
MPRRLIHYLRNERKRLGLTQADIAALLGVHWKTRVSRYEREPALPPLDAGLAYQAIYGKPVSEIFSGASAKVRANVRDRARQLIAKLPASTSRPGELRRKRSLERIAA